MAKIIPGIGASPTCLLKDEFRFLSFLRISVMIISLVLVTFLLQEEVTCLTLNSLGPSGVQREEYGGSERIMDCSSQTLRSAPTPSDGTRSLVSDLP